MASKREGNFLQILFLILFPPHVSFGSLTSLLTAWEMSDTTGNISKASIYPLPAEYHCSPASRGGLRVFRSQTPLSEMLLLKVGYSGSCSQAALGALLPSLMFEADQ